MNDYIKDLLDTMEKLDSPLNIDEKRGTYSGGWYVSIPNIIRRCHFIGDKEKKVLYELLAYMQKNTSCSLYQELIADATDLSRGSVNSALKSLEQLGIIKKGGDSNSGKKLIYQLNRLVNNPYLLLSDVLRKVKNDIVDLVVLQKKLPSTKKEQLLKRGTKEINRFIKDERYMPIIELMKEQHQAKSNYRLAYKEIVDFLGDVYSIDDVMKQQLLNNISEKEKKPLKAAKRKTFKTRSDKMSL